MHTYCMGSIWKYEWRKGHTKPACCKRTRTNHVQYCQTTYSGSKWKGPILGKTIKGNMTYGHKMNIGNDSTTCQVLTTYSRLYQPRDYGNRKTLFTYETLSYCMNYRRDRRSKYVHRETMHSVGASQTND
eukprot:8424875-Heterocapsa_arctica.AAC.1